MVEGKNRPRFDDNRGPGNVFAPSVPDLGDRVADCPTDDANKVCVPKLCDILEGWSADDANRARAWSRLCQSRRLRRRWGLVSHPLPVEAIDEDSRRTVANRLVRVGVWDLESIGRVLNVTVKSSQSQGLGPCPRRGGGR